MPQKLVKINYIFLYLFVLAGVSISWAEVSPQTTCDSFFGVRKNHCSDGGVPGSFWICHEYFNYIEIVDSSPTQCTFHCWVDHTSTGGWINASNYPVVTNNFPVAGSGDWTVTCDDPNMILVDCTCVPKEKPCDSTGNPILPVTGYKIDSDIDYQTKGAYPLQVHRGYRGLLDGGNWYFEDMKRLVIYDIKDDTQTYLYTELVFIRPDGYQQIYRGDSTNGYDPLQAKNANHLEQWLDQSQAVIGWKLIKKNGEEYYDTRGNLKRDVNKHGLSHSFESDLRSNPPSVTVTDDQTGEQLVYHLNYAKMNSGKWQVDSITLPDTNVINYSYMTVWPDTGTGSGNGKLETVTYPDSAYKTYSYADINGNGSISTSERNNYKDFLTGLSKDGQRYASWTYDTNGRAISSEHGALGSGIEKTTIAYTLAGDGSVDEAEITNASGKVSIRHYDYDVNNAKQLIQVEGEESSSGCAASDTQYSYDTNGYRETETNDQGVLTYYDKNTEGLTEVEAHGLQWSSGVGSTMQMNGQSQMLKTTWHSEQIKPTKEERYYRTNPAEGWNTFSSTTGWTKYKEIAYTYDDSDGTSGTYDCTGGGTDDEIATYRVCTATVTDILNTVSRVWTYSYTLHTATGKEMLVDVQTINGPLSGTGDSTTYNFDTSGYLVSVINALGHETTYGAYNSFGLPETITDVDNSVVTTLDYDARGRVISIIADDNGIEAETLLTYYPNGLLETVTQPDGSTLEYFYNNAHQLISIKNNFGEHIDFTPSVLDGQWTLSKTYKATGTSSSDLVAQHERVFDALGRLSKITESNGTITKQVFGYDTNNNLTTHVLKGDGEDTVTVHDKNDIAIEMVYDALDRLTSVLNAYQCNDNNCVDEYNNADETPSPVSPATELPQTKYSYNGQGLISSVEDAKGHVTSFTYNGFGELTLENSPDRGKTKYVYDAAGNLSEKTKGFEATNSGDTQVITYSWDNLNRLTGVNYPGTDEDITYSYDAATSGENCGAAVGRLCRVTRGSVTTTTGHITDYTYNALGRITAEKVRPVGTSGITLTTAYSYNSAGALTGIILPGGRTVAITRSNDRVDEVNSSFGSTPIEHLLADNVAYQAFGGIAGYDMPTNNTSETLRYQKHFNTDGQLTDWQFMKVGDDPLSANYHYDAFGNVQEIEDWGTYSYDAQQRLTSSVGPYGRYSYQYDAVGNRTQMQKQAYTGTGTGITLEDRWIEDFQYDTGSNRLISVDRYTGNTITGTPYRTRAFTHDDRGNIKTDERTEGTTTTTLELEYGNGDRLNGITVDVQ